ncbi:hypothetical protein F4802DRAFT_335113 [Xylaria palmicola]|nr:hypothetical protein F4802DRAFT_335113 [Xylaria palmicola]
MERIENLCFCILIMQTTPAIAQVSPCSVSNTRRHIAMYTNNYQKHSLISPPDRLNRKKEKHLPDLDLHPPLLPSSCTDPNHLIQFSRGARFQLIYRGQRPCEIAEHPMKGRRVVRDEG